MDYKLGKDVSAKCTSRYRWILPVLLVASTAACAALEGVNVGANIPIGGIVNVGASKTIGENQAPAPTQKKPREKSDESSAEVD